MSGFEIAGVVLGVFPIVYETAKDLRGVYKDVKTWWRFETEFEDFISAIDKEFISYSQNLEILLSDLNITEEEQEILQTDPKSSLWYQPRIQAELRRRIQNRYYQWFMGQLGDINNALEELHKLLPVGKVYYVDSTSLEGEMFKVRNSFSHRKDRLLSRIKDRNDSLYAFLDRASHVPKTTSAPHPGVQARTFLQLQEQALALYSCFQRHWSCSCGNGHPCGITVQKGQEAAGRDSNHLKVLFNDAAEPTQLRVEVEVSIVENALPVTPSGGMQSDVAFVREQLSLKSRLRQMRERGSKGIFALAVSSVSTVGNPSSSKIGGSELEKPQSRLQKLGGARLLGRSTSENTTVVKQEISVAGAQANSQTVLAVRQVRFAQSPTSQVRASLPKRPAFLVRNLCHTARGQWIGPGAGFLEIDPEKRLLLHRDPENQRQLQTFKVETLENFLASTPRRDARLRIGLAMITIILNLGRSSLIPAQWSKKELFLLRDPQSTVSQPYISLASLPAALSQDRRQPVSGDQARASLFMLGTLLLELIFRDTLERQPFRADYLGMSGRPNDSTDLCTALRWQKQVEEEFGDGLADAIRRCLVCAFDPTPDLGSSAFVQAVWQNVVRPVETFLSAWSGGHGTAI